MADTPTIEPAEIVAGDTLSWRREDLTADYPACSWTLTYVLAGPQKHTISASADPDFPEAFLVSVPAADTANYQAGNYWWAAYVSKDAERYQIATGQITVKENLSAASAGYDGRSHARKVLDALEAVLEGKATRDTLS